MQDVEDSGECKPDSEIRAESVPATPARLRL
jgi:hypothetical protein